MFLMGGVIPFAHLTVCDMQSFLKSKEHDLFALLFLSDLIGHYFHIQMYQRNFQSEIFFPNDIKYRYSSFAVKNLCPWLVVYLELCHLSPEHILN